MSKRLENKAEPPSSGFLGKAIGWYEEGEAAGFLAAGSAGLTAAAGAVGTTAIFALWCRAKIGGYTGDTLGAACELAEVVPALVVLMFVHRAGVA